ncbi:MAG: zinc metallopeptidase [Bacilli bacterium]|nr:zinc metallopeptidase [Bacilli bacterium]
MIILIIYCLLFFISLIFNIYISLVEKEYKNKKNKKKLTGCELSHEILDLDSNNNSYILLTKGDSLYNSLRDTIKLDEDSFDESTLYALTVSALKSYEAIDKKNKEQYKLRDKLSKLLFYLMILSYILLAACVVLNDYSIGGASLAILVIVTILDIKWHLLYKSNIKKLVKVLKQNGFIDKDEVNDVTKLLGVEVLKPFTRLINVIKELFDQIIPDS